MPETDPSHTASLARRKDTAELAELFREWDAPGPVAPSQLKAERFAIWLRVGVTVALFGLAAVVLVLTLSSLAFWTQPSAPRELGDVRAHWLESNGKPAGKPSAGGLDFSANTFVRLSGLVPTRVVAVSERPTTDAGEVSFLFLCPLFDVVVKSHQPLSHLANSTNPADPRLAEIVAQGLALAPETASSVTAQGRLLHADEAPSELRPFIESYAQRLERAPRDLWVLVEGEAPHTAAWAVWVAALASLAPLISLGFLVRALVATRKRAFARSAAENLQPGSKTS